MRMPEWRLGDRVRWEPRVPSHQHPVHGGDEAGVIVEVGAASDGRAYPTAVRCDSGRVLDPSVDINCLTPEGMERDIWINDEDHWE